jgi:hypothetical protein
MVGAGAVSAKDDIASLAKAMRATKFTDKNVDATIQALALSGIAVYDDPNSDQPIVPIEGTVSPLKLLRWQVRNMALELSARSGALGEKIDAIFPEQPGMPPPSFLLAGYVASAKTPGGELASALIGKRNWKKAPSIVFPSIISMLFASDLALDAAAAGVRPSNQAARWAILPAPGDACAAVEEFIVLTIGSLFDVLSAMERGDRSTLVLYGVWDFVAGLDVDALQALTDNTTDTEVNTIGAMAGALAFGGMVLSYLQSWFVRVDRAPAETRFGVDNEVVTGQLVMSVDNGGFDEWPAEIVDCAAAAGIDLPLLNPADADLTWDVKETPTDLIRDEPDMPAVLDEDGKAIFRYKTNNETRAVSRGTEHRGLLQVKATVERQDFAILQDKIVGAFLEPLPITLDAAVTGLIGKPINDLTRELVSAGSGVGLGIITVFYHELEAETEPEPEPPPPCPIGTWFVADISSFLEVAMEQGGSTGLSLEDTTGRMTYLYTEEGSYKLDAIHFAVKTVANIEGFGQMTVIVTFDGSFSAAYTTDNGEITYDQISQLDTFTITADAYQDGNLITSTPIPPTLLVEDVWMYSCSDDEMKIARPSMSNALVVLKRVED